MEVKKNCMFYDAAKKDCKALNALYCLRENCKFFKTSEGAENNGLAKDKH